MGEGDISGLLADQYVIRLGEDHEIGVFDDAVLVEVGRAGLGLERIGSQPAASYRFWVGEGRVANQQGLQTTPWRDIARRLSYEEATARVFGRPCKRCKEST